MFDFLSKKQVALWLIVLITLITVVINLPRISINKEVGNYKINYIGGYQLNFYNNFQRDLNLKKGLDISGGVQITLKPDLSEIEQDNVKEALTSLKRILEVRVNRFGVNEPNVIVTNFNEEYRVYVEIPGVDDVDRALSLVGQTAKLSFKIEKDNEEQSSDTENTVPTSPPEFIETDLTSSNVAEAVAELQQTELGNYEPSIKLVFDSEGAEEFKEITRNNKNKMLAIYLDDRVLIAPVIRETIPTGEAYITGGFDLETAKDYAIQINSGALPIPVEIVSQNRIGPSVGGTTITKSIIGGIIGLIFVVVFMSLNYRRLGLISILSLILYGLITASVYKLIPITLTLPGVAGFILSIGMAVDSNILIFEKTKEELRKGENITFALENGFKSAWTSIKDANIVSLIIAFILFNPFEWGFLLNSGPVRGFAATLGVGIIISLFTGVYVTRNLVKLFYSMK